MEPKAKGDFQDGKYDEDGHKYIPTRLTNKWLEVKFKYRGAC